MHGVLLLTPGSRFQRRLGLLSIHLDSVISISFGKANGGHLRCAYVTQLWCAHAFE